MPKVGMSDVAAAAGVSVSTVSVVLNRVKSARVHPQTRERIWKAANDLGYVPNGMARGLRLQRSHLIGFVSDFVATTPYAGNMIVGAQEAALSTCRLLMAVDTSGDAAVEETALTSLLQQQVDGVLYAAMYHRSIIVPELLGETPTVLVNAVAETSTVSSVVPDEQGGVRLAVTELLDHGHRRIGYVDCTDRIRAAPLRRRAYRATLRKAGIVPDPAWTAVEPPTSRGGYRAALDILQRSNRPTALFCYKDTMAVGVYQAAHELRLRIPDDLSIIGFDNLELLADNQFPGLTTVSLPHHEMGAWAVRQLIAEITDPATTPQQTKILGKLYRRDSVAPPSGA
ncbi:LacI family DNA-binding transcriptional regulator [Actinoplanes sp. CA-030573]|uniref:LacI family DNA-binding transcriptional regulator n=1 Tax=Actinoplanes sp. CA-030573 TaxID=3239898 RepID=UPI003D91F288